MGLYPENLIMLMTVFCTFMGIIWTPSDLFNLVLKMAFFAFAFWGAINTFQYLSAMNFLV